MGSFDNEKFLGTNDVAAILRLSRHTIYKMVREGKIKAYSIGNKKNLRFRESDIIKLIEVSRFV